MRRFRLDLVAIAMLAACHAPPTASMGDGFGAPDNAPPPELIAGEAAAPPRTAAAPAGDPTGAAAGDAARAGAAWAGNSSSPTAAGTDGNEAGAGGAQPAPPNPAAMPVAGTPSSRSVACGNGVSEPGETCDGNCPKSCDDHDPCTTDTLTGIADQCNVRCTHVAITVARGADSCCPAGANTNTDSDCSAVCGNGVVEGWETCDGDCPTRCTGSTVCTQQQLVGAASQCTAQCVVLHITEAASGDGCCPPGANANNDNDCSPYCGNKVKEPGETCDGDCPTHESCYWRSGCARPVLTGVASQCSSQCETTMITAAANGDGCCPPGANANNDNDCSSVCGNNVKEPGEMCDGDCPESELHCKDDDPCSLDRVEGSGCSRHCAAPSRAPVACTDVPSGWNMGTIASGSCPTGFGPWEGRELPESNGTTSLWCGAGNNELRCSAGDKCVAGTEKGTIVCLMKTGEDVCPAGKSGRVYESNVGPMTVCCGGR